MRYDATSIPESYQAARALKPADVERWMILVREVMPPGAGGLVIDLGCGPGRFTVPLAEQLGVTVVGVDPSRKMLQEAERAIGSAHVMYREGRAESIPMDEHLAALIFMSNAIHHVQGPDVMLVEMDRVLRPDGIVFIRNYSHENLESVPYLQFFPEAVVVSREMLWPRRAFVETFAAGGFVLLSQGTVRQQTAPDFGAYMKKIESRVYSDLALIGDEAFQQGVARMREAWASLRNGPVLEDVDYFVFRRR